jgi:hypothetical protein
MSRAGMRAKSKRSGLPSRAPAAKGYRVCRMQGVRGPRGGTQHASGDGDATTRWGVWFPLKWLMAPDTV